MEWIPINSSTISFTRARVLQYEPSLRLSVSPSNLLCFLSPHAQSCLAFLYDELATLVHDGALDEKLIDKLSRYVAGRIILGTLTYFPSPVLRQVGGRGAYGAVLGGHSRRWP